MDHIGLYLSRFITLFCIPSVAICADGKVDIGAEIVLFIITITSILSSHLYNREEQNEKIQHSKALKFQKEQPYLYNIIMTYDPATE
jgi:hypothetical protein